MFDAISPKYDLLNRLFSFGTDQGWRRRWSAGGTGEGGTSARRGHRHGRPGHYGGGARAARYRRRHLGGHAGPRPCAKVARAGLTDRVELVRGDAAALPFADGVFDAVTVAFGVRNFEDLPCGVGGLLRVLKPGGRLFVLEFSRPRGLLAPFFRFYFHTVMPFIGRLISKDHAAYAYLPASVDAFPRGRRLRGHLESTGRSRGA